VEVLEKAKITPPRITQQEDAVLIKEIGPDSFGVSRSKFVTPVYLNPRFRLGAQNKFKPYAYRLIL